MEVYRFAPPTLIEIRGSDRVKWLHSFVSNEIRDLPPGSWREVFVTDAKGKTFSHGSVCCFHERLYYVCLQGGQAADLIAHWDRYIIREDVELADHSPGRAWHAVTTSDLQNFCQQRGVSVELAALETSEHPTAGKAVGLDGHESALAILGFALPLQYSLVTTPAQPDADEEPDATQTVQMLAAANRFPWFGIDFDRNNLPQEIARDHQAISFKKGCYLGQETVARLDALGQVQKQLFPVIINRHVETSFAPQDLYAEEELAGRLTSAYPSGGDHAVGFAMLRRKFIADAGDLTTSDGTTVSLQSV